MSDAASMTPDASLRHAFVAADAMFSTVIEMAQVAEGWGTELFDADAALAGMCGGVKNMALYVGVLRRALTELRLAIPETPIIDLPPSGADT